MEDYSDLRIHADFDAKVESIAAAILHQREDLALEQVIVAPIGASRRRSSKELKAVSRRLYEEDTALLLEVYRKGFADTLPENLLLRLDEDYKSPIEKAKAIRRQTEDARKFFLPFEQATYTPRIETERLEQRLTEEFPLFIEQIWDLPRFADVLTKRQRFILCHLLPETQRIVGDWKVTEMVFEAVLGKKIRFQKISPLEISVPEEIYSESEELLGETFIGDSFKDDIPALEINIYGIYAHEYPRYGEGGDIRRVIDDLLCSYFIPIDVPLRLQLLPHMHDELFEMGKSFMGFNTKLGKS